MTAAEDSARFTERRKRPRWGTLLLVGALHVLAFIGLMRAFAPDFTAAVVEHATSLVTVTVTTPPPEPRPEPSREAPGAAGEEGRKAVPREVTAPKVVRPPAVPAPHASSTGSAEPPALANRVRAPAPGAKAAAPAAATAGAVPAASL